MKKIIIILALSLIVLNACHKKNMSAPALVDYRDKWVGIYYCKDSEIEFDGSASPRYTYYFFKDTISITKTVIDDSAIDALVVGKYEYELDDIHINTLGDGANYGEPIKFYPNDSIYLYVINDGEAPAVWPLGGWSHDTYLGKKIN